jgi:CRISPR/Cas system type I-B associated protein Csh2 (Cas7 group RAMP superfamily)
MTSIEKISNRILSRFNMGIVKKFPRHSTRFVRVYFKNKPLQIAEIGTYKGENAKNILKKLNVKKIYLIDPWEEHQEYLCTQPKQTQKNLSLAEKKLEKF